MLHLVPRDAKPWMYDARIASRFAAKLLLDSLCARLKVQRGCLLKRLDRMPALLPGFQLETGDRDVSKDED